MRRLALSLAALLLVSACNEAPSGPPAPALWEATGPDGAHGWLFGTTHSLPDDYDWRTPIFEDAFAKAQVLVVEADITRTPGPIFEQLALTPRLGLPSARVDAPNRTQVAAAFSKAGIAEDNLRDTETWAVALILGGEFAYGEPENGVDIALMNQRGTKPVVELEGILGQLRIFDSLSHADQVELLEIVAAEIGTAKEDGEQLAAAWRSGDTDALDAEMNGSFLADPELHEALLTRRNQAWAAQLDGMLRKGDSLFVAVGAGHMVGPTGLPTLLTTRGFKVKRIQ